MDSILSRGCKRYHRKNDQYIFKNIYDENIFNFKDNILKDRQIIRESIALCMNKSDQNVADFLIVRNGDLIESPVLFFYFKTEINNMLLSDLLNFVELNIGPYKFGITNKDMDILMKIYQLEPIKINSKIIACPLPIDMMLGKNIIPLMLLQYYEARITIGIKCEGLEDILLRCDFIELLDENNIQKEMSMAIRQVQSFRQKVESKIELPFLHDVSAIYFYFCDNNDNIITRPVFKYMDLAFNTRIFLQYSEEFIKYDSKCVGIPGVYLIKISHKDIQDHGFDSINFSFVAKLYLHLNLLEHDIKICVMALNTNIFTFKEGTTILHYEN